MDKLIFNEEILKEKGYIYDLAKTYMFKSIIRNKKSAIIDIAVDGDWDVIGDSILSAELADELLDALGRPSDIEEMSNDLARMQREDLECKIDTDLLNI